MRGGRRKGAGRPRGTYKWTPDDIGYLMAAAHDILDAAEMNGEKLTIREVARQLKTAKYKEETIRKMLEEDFERWRKDVADRNEINRRIWAHLLGEAETDV